MGAPAGGGAQAALGAGVRCATGTYGGLFRVFNVDACELAEAVAVGKTATASGAVLEASKTPTRPPVNALTGKSGPSGTAVDSSQKLLHLAWHPTMDAIAAAASNSLY